MKKVLEMIENGSIEEVDLAAFDKVITEAVVAFMVPHYYHGDKTAVAFSKHDPVMVQGRYREEVLPTFLAHFCMDLTLCRDKSQELLELDKGGHHPFYIHGLKNVMVEAKCREDKIGRDTAYGCFNATLYDLCDGKVTAEGVFYCEFIFPHKAGSHPERLKHTTGLALTLKEKADDYFWYK